MFVVAMLVGCSTVAVIDTIPQGDKKGYVNFYLAEASDRHLAVRIGAGRANLEKAAQVKYGRDMYERMSRASEGPTLGILGQKLLSFNKAVEVAAAPGNQDFTLACVGTLGVQTVTVTVREGAVTPVKVQIQETKAENNIRYYSVSATPESPKPRETQ
ncbi:MAG: hypothetical protein WCI03_14435 [bacterium]